jgi:molybdenum cofactor cytidylyltransferase
MPDRLDLRIVAVVPAAGRSRRMGAPKALVDVDGRPMLLATLAPLVEVGTLDVVVVTSTPIAEAVALDLPRTTVVINDDPATEMVDSIRLGMRSVGDAAVDGWLVLPGDQPGLPAADVRGCVDAFAEDRTRIVVAARDGRRGHPIVFPDALAAFVHGADCDGGLNELRRRFPERIRLVEGTSGATLRNLNRPEDVDRLRDGD